MSFDLMELKREIDRYAEIKGNEWARIGLINKVKNKVLQMLQDARSQAYTLEEICFEMKAYNTSIIKEALKALIYTEGKVHRFPAEGKMYYVFKNKEIKKWLKEGR